jgi:hypothetical protein
MPTPALEHRNRHVANLKRECSHLPLKKRLPYRTLRDCALNELVDVAVHIRQRRIVSSTETAQPDNVATESHTSDTLALPFSASRSTTPTSGDFTHDTHYSAVPLPYFEAPPLSAREALANKIRARALGLKVQGPDRRA